MAAVYLISEKTIKSYSLINDNVGGEFIKPAVETSQEIFLQELIGTQLLRTLKGMVANTTEPMPEDYKVLLDEYITPYLLNKVTSEITIPLAYKYRNAGIVQSNTEYANNTQMRDAQTLKTYYDERANFYAIRLGKFLKAHTDKYPEYCACSSCGDIKADKMGYNTTILLD